MTRPSAPDTLDGYDPADNSRKCYELAIATKRAALLKERSAKLTIELPWPSRMLSPNARIHWAVKAKAAKKARQTAGWAARASGARRIDAKALSVTVTFLPPDRRRRDIDGMLSSIKSGLDGIADVIGVDDSNWDIAIRRGEPVRNGLVQVEIEVKE